MNPENYDTFSAVAERFNRGQPLRALGAIGLSTLQYAHPPKEHPYRDVRKYRVSTEEIPLNPSVKDVTEEISHILEHTPQSTPTKQLSTEQLSWFVSALYQFSDRNGVADAMTTPYETIQALHDRIITHGDRQPTPLPQQLALALEDAPTIPSAVWNLFLTSRHYARWRDQPAIAAPPVSYDEKQERMQEWEGSVAAIKHPDSHGYQDAAGDTYYAWTQALARIIYKGLPEKRTLLRTGYETAFAYGAHIMSVTHSLGRLSVLGTMSNHTPAAQYGNKIGDTLVRAMKHADA